MLRSIKIILMLIVALESCFFSAYAQDSKAVLSASEKKQISGYKNLAKKYISAKNYSQATLYFNKIAYIYWEARYSSEAIEFFNKSLEANEKTGNTNAVWAINNNIGMIFSDMEKYKEALTAFNKGLEAAQKMNEKEKIASSLKNIGNVQKYLKQYEKANESIQKALSHAQELNNLKLIRSCYASLSENYKILGNSEESVKYYKLYAVFDKKIQKEEMQKMRLEAAEKVANAKAKVIKINEEKKRKELLLELEKLKVKQANDSIAQINLEKKREIERINNINKIKEQKAKIEKEKFQKKIYLFGIIVVFIFLIILFYQIKQKIKANEQLHVQNIQLQKQKNIIDQNNRELEKKNRQILDSIEYASKIQEAILPSQKAIEATFTESFIIYKPKDIVSGDFYWFSKQNEKIYIAAVDCTGHSVPGAFMSMMGNTLLNEIINEKKIQKPSEILKQLNFGIVKALKKQNAEVVSEDGMDISICCIDIDNKKLELGAANHSIFIIKDKKLEIIEGDIYSIGDSFFAPEDTKFMNHELAASAGTTIYIFSDGFQDQFGGKNNKKFMAENFKQIILKNADIPMNQQKEKLIKAFENWRGNNVQTDDVLVIGIKL